MFLVPEAGFSFIRYVNLPVPLSKRFQIGKNSAYNKKELDMNFIW